MFLGEYQTRFSGPGRIVLPSKFRKELTGKKIILSRGFEGCIWGFREEDWKEEAEKQLQASANEEESRKLRRYLFSGAEEVVIDIQGRFVIPSHLIKYAGLMNEVILVGLGDRFEIWNKFAWQEILRQITKKSK